MTVCLSELRTDPTQGEWGGGTRGLCDAGGDTAA